MIYSAPSTSFEAVADGFATGLTGTIGVRLRDNAGADAIARATAGIAEDIAGSGIYRVVLTAPATAGQYTVVWDTGGGSPVYATEELVVTMATVGSVVSAGSPPAYITLAAAKASLALTGQTYADDDIILANDAASRGIDAAVGRRFYLDPDATQVRYYSPQSQRRLEIDDCALLASVAIDRAGSGTYGETWTNGTEFVMEPFNAAGDYRPFESLIVRRLSGLWLPWYVEKSVRVTGQFGWAILPEDIKAATAILAAKLLRRVREAPFGIVTVGIDGGAAMRIARTDPDVYNLIRGYSRHAPFI